MRSASQKALLQEAEEMAAATQAHWGNQISDLERELAEAQAWIAELEMMPDWSGDEDYVDEHGVQQKGKKTIEVCLVVVMAFWHCMRCVVCECCEGMSFFLSTKSLAAGGRFLFFSSNVFQFFKFEIRNTQTPMSIYSFGFHVPKWLYFK